MARIRLCLKVRPLRKEPCPIVRQTLGGSLTGFIEHIGAVFESGFDEAPDFGSAGAGLLSVRGVFATEVTEEIFRVLTSQMGEL